MTFLLIALLFLVLLLAYFGIARHFNIIDYPHERGSHQRPTIRGGGVLFPIAALTWFLLFGQQDVWAIAGLMLISAVSFADDIKNINATARFLVHFVAVSLLFYEIGIFNYYWYWVVFAYILTVGCVNAVNFMDGINGITSFYTLVTLGTFSLLNNYNRLLASFFEGHPPVEWSSFISSRLVGVLFISVVVFAFFNARKRARAFAGDVGSISIAFILSWFMINLMVMSNSFYWILIFAVYGIDTGFTILFRIRRKENIMKPHRLHLYQLLVNEKGWPHLLVAGLYAVVQLLVNAVTIWLVFTGNMNIFVFISLLAIVSFIYIIARLRIKPQT